MSDTELLKKKLEAAEKRIALMTTRIQLYEQYIHRAGMVINANGLAAKRILDLCGNLLPQWVKNSLTQVMKDGKKGVIVSEDDPELQMNWEKEYVGAGSGAANGPHPTVWAPKLTRSSAVPEDYGLVWDVERNEYVLK